MQEKLENNIFTSPTALNSGSSRLISTKTVDWLLVLGGGCQMIGAEK